MFSVGFGTTAKKKYNPSEATAFHTANRSGGKNSFILYQILWALVTLENPLPGIKVLKE
jgi:hypothetical protein